MIDLQEEFTLLIKTPAEKIQPVNFAQIVIKVISHFKI